MTTLWAFMEYVDDADRGVVSEWISDQSIKVEVKFHQRLQALSQMRVDEWRDPWAKTLHGDGKGLVEIRFKAENVQFRPIGFFGPNRNQFTILLCAKEIGGKFVPRQACNLAQGRKNEVLEKAYLSRSYDFE